MKEAYDFARWDHFFNLYLSEKTKQKTEIL